MQQLRPSIQKGTKEKVINSFTRLCWLLLLQCITTKWVHLDNITLIINNSYLLLPLWYCSLKPPSCYTYGHALIYKQSWDPNHLKKNHAITIRKLDARSYSQMWHPISLSNPEASVQNSPTPELLRQALLQHAHHSRDPCSPTPWTGQRQHKLWAGKHQIPKCSMDASSPSYSQVRASNVNGKIISHQCSYMCPMQEASKKKRVSYTWEMLGLFKYL